jgi:hypothetical protein
MIHAVTKMERRTRKPIPIHTKMISNRDLSSLSDAHSSMALKIRSIPIPHPQDWITPSHKTPHRT